MARILRVVMLVALPLALASCASTQLVNMWSDPGGDGSVKLTNVMALVITKDEIVRRAGEDQLVASLQPTRSIASYKLFSDAELKDKDRVRQGLQAIGVDGVVTMRLVGATEEPVWGPLAYPTFWGYYGYASPMMWGPGFGPGYGYGPAYGYAYTNTIVRLETKVYALKGDRLIWGAVSDTFNPSSAQFLVDDVAKVVVVELKKRGFVQ